MDGIFGPRVEHDFANLRMDGRNFLIDEFDQEGVQEIELDFTEGKNAAMWPGCFEQYLQALPSEALCAHIREVTRKNDNLEAKVADPNGPNLEAGDSAQGISKKSWRAPDQSSVMSDQRQTTGSFKTHESIQKVSSISPTSPQRGRDFLPFSGSMNRSCLGGILGILHDLPTQSGFPGFQRVSFMRYCKQHAPNLEDVVTLSDEDLDCHEGVVLPGGHIIIGRWWYHWYPEQPVESGPFIMWEVEE